MTAPVLSDVDHLRNFTAPDFIVYLGGRLIDPTLTTITPSTVVAGTTGVVLSLVGTDFTPYSVVTWLGSPLVTTFVDATHLTAAVTDDRVQFAGTATVNVWSDADTPNTTNGSQVFTIT